MGIFCRGRKGNEARRRPRPVSQSVTPSEWQTSRRQPTHRRDHKGTLDWTDGQAGVVNHSPCSWAGQSLFMIWRVGQNNVHAQREKSSNKRAMAIPKSEQGVEQGYARRSKNSKTKRFSSLFQNHLKKCRDTKNADFLSFHSICSFRLIKQRVSNRCALPSRERRNKKALVVAWWIFHRYLIAFRGWGGWRIGHLKAQIG